MKTAGIVADNYKLEKFKAELTKNGFKDFTIVPFVDNTSTIKVKCHESDYIKIKNLCTKVEMHFKQSN